MTTVVQTKTDQGETVDLQTLKQSINIKTEDVEEDSPMSKSEQAAREAWKPRKWGRCGSAMWRYYFCNVDEKLPKGSKSSCCDADHLSMHIFFLTFFGSFVVLFGGLTRSTGTDGRLPPIIWYFFGMGWGLGVCVWGFWQLSRVLNRRMSAAVVMDANQKLKKERGNLQDNINNAIDKKKKLAQTHARTVKTTKALKRKFNDIKKWTDQNKVISDENSKIGAVLNDKLGKLMVNIEQELIESEKHIVVSVYEQMHFKDGEAGLDRKEFAEFINKLPDEYREKFKFETGPLEQYFEDGIFDRNELFHLLDGIAEETVNKT